MLGLNGLPKDDKYNRVYYAVGNSATDWQLWHKPEGSRFIFIVCLGAGSGGGGGFSAAAGNNRGGGGGGGSGVYATFYFSAFLCPDVLYLQPGVGGAGGAASGNGSTGTLSYVSIQPSKAAVNLIYV